MLSFDEIMELCVFRDIIDKNKESKQPSDHRYVEHFKTVIHMLNEQKDFPYRYMCDSSSAKLYTRCLQIGRVNKFDSKKQFVAALEIPDFNYLGICFVNGKYHYQYCIMNNTLWVRALLSLHRSKSRFVDDETYGFSLRWIPTTEREEPIRDPLKLEEPLYVKYIKPLVDNYVGNTDFSYNDFTKV